MRDFQQPGRSAVFAQNGVCATSHPLGAKVAIETLENGGNAVDAAIAGALVLGIAEPAMTGIGGDMFALIKPAGSEDVVGLNASGRGPAGLDAAALRAQGLVEMDVHAAHSVVVPGAIAGFAQLSEDHGAKGLADLVQPAIRYADEGIPVAPRAAFDWARAKPNLAGEARRHYLNNNTAFQPGELFRQPGQAEALRRVAAEGARGFYEGEVAEDMVASLQALGGAHTMEDFAASAPEYMTPITGPYRGAEIVELPPNTHGATALLMARMLERFDIASLDPMGAMRAHIEAETAKIAYAARDEAIADADHMTMSVADYTSPENAARLATMIDLERAGPVPLNPMGAQHRDTIYITVVDKDRMAVSLIYSVFHSFGSGLASTKFGINFNNRAAGFNLIEGHVNEAGGSKRPLHTIIPGMLREGGRITMPFGVMGGAYQPNGHARLISNIVDFGMDVQAAIDAPRSFFTEGTLGLEAGYSSDVWTALEAKGHALSRPEVAIGGAQAIRIDHDRGVLIAGSDPRKDGIALGY